MKISVCMASYNGAKYIKEQISSILIQLNENDELIISDDGSTDNTVNIINSFNDSRIILVNHTRNRQNGKSKYPHYLVSSNFENALNVARGELIFLSDQDDIWCTNKVEVLSSYLKKYLLVMSDCSIIDQDNKIIAKSFFDKTIVLPRGLLQNIVKPLYHGCCIAFRREVLNVALPFPNRMILHDSWIGILAEKLGQVKFIDDQLVLYRRHSSNSSYSPGKSKNSFFFQFTYRVRLFFQVVKRLFLDNSSNKK